jgi:hypothetical protein
MTFFAQTKKIKIFVYGLAIFWFMGIMRLV